MFLGTFVLIFVAMGLLFVIDTFLARIEHAESQAQAMRLLAEGRELAKLGRASESIERFRTAVATSPDDPEAELALVRGLLQANQLADAETLLTEMLRRDPTDGTTNELMARVLAKEGKTAEATTYYHTAIYGRWPKSEEPNRVAVRFELIELLAKTGAKRELLAELLTLGDEAPKDDQMQMRIARFFIMAGSPSRGADVYRQMVRRNPDNPDGHAGLAEAYLAAGNFKAAQNEFSAAARLRPDDAEIRGRVQVITEIMALDPTGRRMRGSERYRRSEKLVRLSLDSLNRCVGSTAPEAIRPLVEEGNAALKKKVRASQENEAADDDQDLADKLWQARNRTCHEPPQASEEALARVMNQLAQ